jgi:hypothetical protein
MFPVSNGSIGFQHKDQRFFQIPFGFGQRSTLSVYTGDLFNVTDVPFSPFHVDRAKLTNHNDQRLTKNLRLVKNTAGGAVVANGEVRTCCGRLKPAATLRRGGVRMLAR